MTSIPRQLRKEVGLRALTNGLRCGVPLEIKVRRMFSIKMFKKRNIYQKQETTVFTCRYNKFNIFEKYVEIESVENVLTALQTYDYRIAEFQGLLLHTHLWLILDLIYSEEVRREIR